MYTIIVGHIRLYSRRSHSLVKVISLLMAASHKCASTSISSNIAVIKTEGGVTSEPKWLLHHIKT